MANRILGKTYVSGGIHNRVVLEYTVTTNNETTYTLSITVKYRYYREKGEIAYITSIPAVRVTGTGHDAKNSGSKKPNYKTTTQETTFISTFSWSWTKGHAPQTITVTAYNQDYGSAYTASVTLTVPERKYYNVSYNTNSGTGAIAGQKKYHGQALTLTTSKPSKSGYTFKGWAVSEAKAKAGEATYPAGESNTYESNAALALWAVWEVIYQKPTIKITSIERCNQNGSANDEGEWAKVIFDWSVFKTSPKYYNGSDTGYSANVGKTVVITIGSISETVTLSGQSGSNVPQIIGASETKPFNKDTTYTLNAKITDNYSDYTVSGKLGTVEFPLDFNGDATALGIFRSAPDNAEGIYFGKMPKLVNVTPNTNTYYGATREDNANSSICFGIGSGGVNRGIWIDNNDGRSEAANDDGSWLIYASDATSYVDSGGNTIIRPNVTIPGYLYARIPWARFIGSTSDERRTDTGSQESNFHPFNYYNGTNYSYSHSIGDLGCFEEDTNGIKILKSGTYLFLLSVHYNVQANSSAHGVRCRFYNYTDSKELGSLRYDKTYNSSAPWGTLTNMAIEWVDANKIIIPHFGQYRGTGWFRPSTVWYMIIRLS